MQIVKGFKEPNEEYYSARYVVGFFFYEFSAGPWKLIMKHNVAWKMSKVVS